MYTKYKKYLPRLEFLLPLIYLVIATTIIIYQKMIPDHTEGYDVMTGAVNIRTSDTLLAIFSLPSIPLFYAIYYFFGRHYIQNDPFVEKLLLMTNSGGGGKSSLTLFFIINPICYYLLAIFIRKYLDYSKKSSKRKSPTV